MGQVPARTGMAGTCHRALGGRIRKPDERPVSQTGPEAEGEAPARLICRAEPAPYGAGFMVRRRVSGDNGDGLEGSALVWVSKPSFLLILDKGFHNLKAFIFLEGDRAF